MTERYAVIMAGGQGTRFWPESTRRRPKQLLDLLGIDRSLLRMSFDRAARLVPPSNVLVVTGEVIAGDVRRDLPDLPAENLLVEPVGRNTAPCVGWAATRVGDGTMAVLPADHHIRDEDGFLEVMDRALSRAEKAGHIVTIGIRPSRPETGYGYIEGAEAVDGPVLRAERFVEKPDRATARRYLDAGNFFWNAGIFCFTGRRILADIASFLPDLHAGLEKLASGADPAEIYPGLEGISIDYGVMEKLERGDLEVIPAEFGWSDLGSWNAIWEHMSHDGDGNAVRGGARALFRDVSGCLVSTTRSGKVIALCGVEDLVVVDTPDAVVVVPRERDQEVKALREMARKSDG